MDESPQMRLCRNCFMPIDVRARICPHCHSQTWQGVKFGCQSNVIACCIAIVLLPVVLFVLLLVLGLAFRGCSSSPQSSIQPAVRRSAPPRAYPGPPGRPSPPKKK